jgi:hypothetical protein
MTNSMTGSLVNHLSSGAGRDLVPTVGMGATRLMHTDRHAYTVVWVSKSGKTIRVQEDHAKRTDSNGMSESQTYEHTRNTEGIIHTVRLTKRGWRSKQAGSFALGYRSTYHDFSF